MFGKYLKWVGYILIIIGFFTIYLGVPQESLGQALRVITIPQGGTGTSTLPNTGEVLVGNGIGGYKFVNTSTFGGGGGALHDWQKTTDLSAITPTTTVGVVVNASSSISDLTMINATTSRFTFGGVSGTAWSSFCTSITGSADLCDGSDASGGGGGVSDWKKNTALDAITPTTTVGVIINASSTIGNGNGGGGLTINGGATTTVGIKFGTSTVSDIWLGNIPHGATPPRFGSNIVLGQSAYSYPSASTPPIFNIAIGKNSLLGNSATPITGQYNVGLGDGTLEAVTTGSRNLAIGSNALFTNATGADNIGIGYVALPGFAGSQNVAIGSGAFSNIPYDGSGSVAIGYQAGFDQEVGNNNILIGTGVNAPNTTGGNQLNIGNIIYGTNINPGTASVAGGFIGIASTSPSRLLTVNGDIFTRYNLSAGSSTITYASSTGFSATNANVTNATNTNIAIPTSINLFGGGAKTTANDFCIQLTGSAALCDGDDASGGVGGASANWQKNTALDAITPTTTVGIVVNASSSISTLNTGIASTTNFFGADLASCTGASNKLTWSGGKFLCEADQTGGGGSKWTDGGLFTYLTDTADDVVLGSNDTATAPFWFDVSANNLLIGNSSSADSQITFGPSSAPFSLGYNNGVFRVSTSTTLGGTDLFTLFSTSTGAIATTTQGMFTFNDLRATVGDRQYSDGETLLPLDTLNVYGPISSGTWVKRECNVMQSSLAAAAISADTANVCGDFMFQEDTTGTNAMLTTGGYGSYYNQIMVANGLPNDGAGLFLWGGLGFGSSTPIFKTVARIASPANATNTQMFLGFTTTAPNATTMQDFPSGCMFVASSTRANWQAYCGNVAGTMTFVDTGVPTTTSQTANANQFYRFSIYADAKEVKFYIATPSASQKLVARIENDMPVAFVYHPAVYLGTQRGGGGSRGIDVKYISVDYNLGI